MTAAAARVGITRESLYRRLANDPVLAAAYRQARTQTVMNAIGGLQTRAADLVGVVLEIATDPNIPAGIRIRAAEIGIEHALRGIEIESIEARLSEIEKRYEHGQTA